MHTFRRLIAIGRPYAGRLLLVGVLTSLGALGELVEPWVYRAIINDIAGVFVSKATGLWPEILESLRGGESEAEPEGPPLGASTPALPPVALPVPPAPEAPARKVAPDTGSPRSRPRHHRRRELQRLVQSVQQPTSQAPLVPPRTVSQAMRTLWMGVLVLLGAAVLAKFFTAGADLLAARVTNTIEQNFILKTFRHALRLPLSYFAQRPSGSISRQIDQSDQIAPIFSAFAQEIWSEVLTALVILAVMVWVNVQLSLIVLIAMLVYVLVTVRMTSHLETHLEEYYSLWDDVAGRIQGAVGGVKTVRAHANEEYEVQRTATTVNHAFQTYLRRKQVETRYSLLQNFLIYVSKALVLGLGGMKALEHQLTPGDVVMLVAYLDRIYSPVHNLTGLYSALQRHVASLHRAFHLLDVDEEHEGERRPVEVREGRVEFRDVEFQYRPDRPLFSNLNFVLEPGAVTALIGPSGAGKTTIADLILGLYVPGRGAIMVDGQDLRGTDPGSLRKQVAVVSPDGTIFRDTLAQNIRYGRLSATDEEVRKAALQAGLGPALRRLPEGLETMLGERGFELSLGERQRVLLARAFVADPRVLILDEATANLDFATEAAVKQTLRQLTRGRTTLIIAHRQSMLTEVDRIVAIRDGRVIEDGAPEVLLAQRGYFYQMMSAPQRGPELVIQ